jgi:hypothetical protein
MGFTACDGKSPEPLDELITPVFIKQVITMLKIDIPVRLLRGLLVAVILAAIPWFEPDVQPFQTRLVDFVQQYAIPICSALLIWYGVRAAL